MRQNRQTDPLSGGLTKTLIVLVFGLGLLDGGEAMAARDFRLKRTSFSALAGWKADAHAEALSAYLKSCARFLEPQGTAQPRPNRKSKHSRHNVKICRAASKLAKTPDDKQARKFFEKHFAPYAVSWKGRKKGLFTGYFEPEYEGARQSSPKYFVPVRGAPENLVSMAGKKKPRGFPRKLTRALQQGGRLTPLPSRGEIENGALDKSAKILVWLADPVDAFFLHIQGSGRIMLPDGGSMRLAFAGRNGHPYSSIGKALLRKGILKPHELSMKSVQKWLRGHKKKARKILHGNKSYIFFREIELDAGLGPLGGEGVSLTGGRSLAIDRRYHAYGLPVWLDTQIPGENGKNYTRFRRLLMAQDTGAAIKGAIRGDIFFGTGKAAGEIAGRVKEPGRMFILLPKKRKKR